MIISRRSGHAYRGSAYETDDSCGNCDGANCDYCNQSFAYYGYDDRWFRTIAEAQEYGEEKEKQRLELVPGAEATDLKHPHWVLKDEKLFCYYYASDEGYKTVPCNEASPLYYALWAEAVDKAAAYDNCPIKDKGMGYHISYCQKFGQCNGPDAARACRRLGRYDI